MKKVYYMTMKKYSALLLAGAIVMPVGMTAYAEGTSSQDTSSNVNIGLDAPDTVGPTDPIIPDPEEDGQTGNTHPLRIDHASNLNFGEIELTEQDLTISLREQRPTARPNVQVSDFRGTGMGWNLQVSTDGFWDGETALRGVELTFERGGLDLKHNDGNPSEAPIAQTVTLSAGSGLTPMMSAETNAGRGTWAYEFGDVVISIPAGSLTGDYTATLNWVLSDAP